jgi:toxin ParE1/3/4
VKVRFTAPADSDLEAIGDWIANDDPVRARSFVRELRKVAGTLARYPQRYPLLPGSVREVRKKVHGQYLILYRVFEEEVQILRVVHGSRELTEILDSAQ